jgi:capsular exopolysaccharide synthesis family protein
MVNKMVEEDAEVMRLREKIGAQGKQLHNIRSIAKKASDPTIKRLEEEIAYAGRVLKERRRQLGLKFQHEADLATQDQTPAELDEIRQYLDILQEQEKSLRTQIAEMDSEMRSLNVKSIDLHWIEDEITVAGDVAKTVGTEVESMNVELEAPPRIRLLEPAHIPGLSDPLRKFKVVGIAGLGGMVAFLGALSLWEHRARRIDTVDEVVHGLGIKLLGALPALPSRRQNNGQLMLKQRLLIESIDAVRTLLLHLASQESLRVVMVTSAVKGEGKTSLSCHLATSLARAGHKVLLVDTDLRHPSSHRVLNETLVPGLCEYLRGESGVEEVIRLTQIGMLYLLPAGQCDPLAIEGLARVQLGQLLASLRSSFDFIIVDSSPLLPVSDSLIVSQHVDAVLFSILREVSRVPDVHAAYEKLSMLGVRILGAVVAGIHEGTGGYGYNYTARSTTPLPQAHDEPAGSAGSA